MSTSPTTPSSTVTKNAPSNLESKLDRRAFLALTALELLPQEHVTVEVRPSHLTIHGAPRHVRKFVRTFWIHYRPNLTQEQLDAKLREIHYGFTRKAVLWIESEDELRAAHHALRALQGVRVKVRAANEQGFTL